FPTGSNPHSTSAWFKTDVLAGNVLGWGMFKAREMLVMQLQSPAHIKMEGFFSNGQVEGDLDFDMGQWVHVMHSYESGSAKLYVNGVLDHSTTGGKPMDMPTPLNFQIGGFSQWKGYKFTGDIDDVHISNVTRSADWVKMEYENQKPLQTLTGWIVPPGSDFSVSQQAVSVPEGGSVKLTAAAGGALKTVWTLIDGEEKTIIATNTLAVDLPGHRVTADKQLVLRFSGVYPTEVKTIDIAVTLTDVQPDPVFTLTAPATWNGRDPIDVTAQVSNLAEMQAAGVGTPTNNWKVSNVAVIKESTTGKLTLKRSQGSGDMDVTLSMDNGGTPTHQSVSIKVQEPATDAWVLRTPGANEKPEDGQFYARSTGGKGTIHYNGNQNGASKVYLKALEGNTVVAKTTKATAEGAYRLSVEVDAKLTHYSVEFGTVDADGGETPVATVKNLLCGDAYIIQGQSNAEATAFGVDDNPATNPWIKTWGSMGTTTGSGFHTAVHRKAAKVGQVGYWALELARRIVTRHKVPVFIINGAKGGTRVDEHQRNDADPADKTTIYGRLLTRIQGAQLTHGIRGVLWHQGEQDQGAEAPTGLMDWETYQEYFNKMSADWKSDFPNIAHYYIFQIWPAACGSMREGSENILREKQRSLPNFYSNMRIMSTLGIRPGSGCHYSPAGYDEMARLIFPLIERDNYGKVFTTSITPPDIKRAYYSTVSKNEITLEFDQPISWKTRLCSEFYLDGERGLVTSGTVSGNVLTLTLNAASTATKITYLDSRSWNQDNILMGTNNIAALTFWEVPIHPDEN
ncbi:MAG: DUF2341 domain-containing protein, partial [Deltaproteobacteria bacterium]